MAAEILAIPLTTVASESAFSAGGRVIDPHRSSLVTKIVDMLICGADWYRHYYGLQKKKAKVPFYHSNCNNFFIQWLNNPISLFVSCKNKWIS